MPAAPAPHDVLVISHRHLRDSFGGTEALAADLALALLARGHRVTRLAVGNGPAVRRDAGVLELTIPPRFGASYPAGWTGAESAQADVAQALLSAAGVAVDAVHVVHFARIGLALAARLAERSPVTVTLTDYTAICPDHQLIDHVSRSVCSGDVPPERCRACCGRGHGDDVTSWRRRNLAFLRDVAAACFVQTPEQRRLLVAAGVPAEKIVADRAAYRVPAGWPSRFARASGGGPAWGFVGRISREKGMHVIVDALDRLGGLGDATLTVAGAWEDGDAYAERVVERLRAVPGVAVRRSVPHAELGALVASFDALLVPSVWLENHPRVLTYALALGVPAICSDVPSLTHLAVEDGVHFAPAGDAAAWAHVLAGPPPAPPAAVSELWRRREADRFAALVDRLEANLRRATPRIAKRFIEV
jgi:glycosyltransferase involved in cell wall biosynthesis